MPHTKSYLKDTHPNLFEQLVDSNLIHLTTRSNRKVQWVCSKNHTWIATPSNRTRKEFNGDCPVCLNRVLLPGFNDLETVYPEISKLWHPSLNLEAPSQLVFGSAKKVWWTCSNNHARQLRIVDMVAGKACLFCCNQKVLTGFNDLQTQYPEIAEEYSSCNKLPATEVLAGSGKRVWWKCEQSHEWQATIAKRTNQKTICPICSKAKRRSKGEIALGDWLEEQFVVERNNRTILKGRELDIYLPFHNVALEYDGAYWHNIRPDSAERDKTKNDLCKKLKIYLIRVDDTDWTNKNSLTKESIRAQLVKVITADDRARELYQKWQQLTRQGKASEAAKVFEKQPKPILLKVEALMNKPGFLVK